MHLNYQHLFYFKVVVEEGSISKAAKALKIGQPALSFQIKKLEEQLGHELFHRVKRRLVLNEAGKTAYEIAYDIFSRGDELKQFFSNRTFDQKSHLSIGILSAVPKSFITKLVEFIQGHSECQITLYEYPVEELFAKLKSRELDIAITDQVKSVYDPRMATRSCQVFGEEVALYGSSEFLKKSQVNMDYLKKTTFILPRKTSNLRKQIDQFFLENNIPHDFFIETEDSALRKQLAIDGKGLIFLSPFVADYFVKTKLLKKVGGPYNMTEKYWIHTRPRKIKVELIEAIFEKFQIK